MQGLAVIDAMNREQAFDPVEVLDSLADQSATLTMEPTVALFGDTRRAQNAPNRFLAMQMRHPRSEQSLDLNTCPSWRPLSAPGTPPCASMRCSASFGFLSTKKALVSFNRETRVDLQHLSGALTQVRAQMIKAGHRRIEVDRIRTPKVG
jgi:hypothetical protein